MATLDSLMLQMASAASPLLEMAKSIEVDEPSPKAVEGPEKGDVGKETKTPEKPIAAGGDAMEDQKQPTAPVAKTKSEPRKRATSKQSEQPQTKQKTQ